MRGFPKWINSREDCEYVQQHFPATQWVPVFQRLLATVKDWFYVKELSDKADGLEDATHKIVESQSFSAKGDSETIYSQYEYRENPNAELFRFGYTVPEVEAIVRIGLDMQG